MKNASRRESRGENEKEKDVKRRCAGVVKVKELQEVILRVGLNLYKQPLSLGRISAGISALSSWFCLMPAAKTFAR